MSRQEHVVLPLRSRVIAAVVVLVTGAGGTGAFAQAPPDTRRVASQRVDARLESFDIRLNGRSLGTWTLLNRNGALHVRVADLPVWGIRPRDNVLVREELGQVWYSLGAIEGAELRYLGAENRLELQVPPSVLMPPGLPPLPGPGASAVLPSRPAPDEGTSGTRLIPLDVLVNGSRSGNWLLLDRGGVLHAPREAFDEWRLSPAASAEPFDFRGQRWLPLSSVPGFESVLDPATQSIQLRFSPAAFTSTRLAPDAAPARPPLSPPIPAAFLNYDLNFGTQTQRGSATTRELGALLEVGASNALGVLTSSFLTTGLGPSTTQEGSRWRRLETTFTRDFPDSNTTLRLGDGTTRPGVGGRAVYFGGVQLARNFELSPGIATQPIPVVTGVSSAPSTVELYVNDTLRQTSRVPAGPFTIDNPAGLSGSGQARVVVRDLLGRETVIVQDFFTSSLLLEPGLSDWSVEAGAVRQNLTQENADYGQAFVSGLYRQGLTTTQTAEAKAELGTDTQALTLALTRTLSSQVLFQGAISRSRDVAAGSGWLGSLGMEHRRLQHGFSARLDAATIGYRQLGTSASFIPSRMTASLAYNYTHSSLGSLGVAFARVVGFQGVDIDTYTLNYSTRLGSDASLLLSLNRVNGSTSATSVAATFVVPLWNRWTSSSNVTSRDGRTDMYTSVVAPLTQETGVGGRALAGTRAGRTYNEGGVYYQGPRGFGTADVAASDDSQALRLGARGGIAVAAGQVFASRRIEDSFAVVEVPGYANVGVGFQGSTLTRTNADGVAILPRLRAYDSNSIRLDPRELPISAELDNLEQVTVPPARSAVRVTFPVRTGRGALIKLVLDDGEPAPAGAEVELVGDKKVFYVARRGEAFITGLQDRNQIRLQHRGQSCTVDVALPPTKADDIARVGPLTCSGVRR